MTRDAKITGIISSLLGIVVGASLGVYVVNKIGGLNETMQIISARSVLFDFAARQFSYADIPHAREAAELEIRIEEQLQRAAPDTFYHTELALAYTRLALVEETAGHKGAERAAFDKAELLFKKHFPHEEATDERLKMFLSQFDHANERSRL